MAPPKAAPRRALDAYLADGEWHTRAAAINHIAPHVPPGQAIRQAHRNRARLRAIRGNTGPANPTLSRASDDCAVGAHHVARDAIRSAITWGAVEQTTTPDGTVLIRRTPSA